MAGGSRGESGTVATKNGNNPFEKGSTSGPEERAFSLALADPAEVWTMAKISAYYELRKELIALHDSPGLGITETQARLQALLEKLRVSTDARWEEFVSHSPLSVLHADSLLAIGPPDHAQFDLNNKIASISWNEARDEDDAIWSLQPVQVPGDESDVSFFITPPYRPVYMDRLPEGTIQLPVREPIHAATIAINEVISALLGDIERLITEVGNQAAWRRMKRIAWFYTRLVESRIRDLALDDYRDWVPALPASISVNEAPSLIAKSAANSIVMQLLSLRTISAFLFDAISRAEDEASNESADDLVAQVLSEIRSYHANIKASLDAFNQMLISHAGKQGLGLEVYVVARPIPRNTPIVTLIPKEHASIIHQPARFRGP